MEEKKIAIRQTNEDETPTSEEIRKELEDLLANLSRDYLLSII